MKKHITTLLSRTFLAVLLLGMFSLTFAQKVDARAKTILDAVSANYKAKNNTYFKFLYGTGANGKISKTETGIFYSAKNKYKLKIMGTEQIFDGNKVYSISEEDQEITIAKPNGSETMFSPINYIDEYKKSYNVTYVGKRNIKGISTDLIKLVPTKDTGIKEVYLFVNSAKKQLVKLEQVSKNNDLAVIEITQYKENLSIPANMFSFNKSAYKNYIITEL